MEAITRPCPRYNRHPSYRRGGKSIKPRTSATYLPETRDLQQLKFTRMNGRWEQIPYPIHRHLSSSHLPPFHVRVSGTALPMDRVDDVGVLEHVLPHDLQRVHTTVSPSRTFNRPKGCSSPLAARLTSFIPNLGSSPETVAPSSTAQIMSNHRACIDTRHGERVARMYIHTYSRRFASIQVTFIVPMAAMVHTYHGQVPAIRSLHVDSRQRVQIGQEAGINNVSIDSAAQLSRLEIYVNYVTMPINPIITIFTKIAVETQV